MSEQGSEILSYGGGVQSVAMVVLVASGRLPRPSAIIAADTSREVPTTWEYADKYVRPMLATIGMELHIAPHSLSTVDLYSYNGDILLPIHTATGKLPTFCSTEWKARVVERYARTVLNLPKPYTYWIGFSLDEKRRATPNPERRYPLLELMLSRVDCLQIIEQAGLPVPSKSRCWMCPNQRDSEWLQLKRDMPGYFQKAVELEREIREDERFANCFFHISRKPLDQVAFDENSNVQPMQCGLGWCFI